MGASSPSHYPPGLFNAHMFKNAPRRAITSSSEVFHICTVVGDLRKENGMVPDDKTFGQIFFFLMLWHQVAFILLFT